MIGTHRHPHVIQIHCVVLRQLFLQCNEIFFFLLSCIMVNKIWHGTGKEKKNLGNLVPPVWSRFLLSIWAHLCKFPSSSFVKAQTLTMAAMKQKSPTSRYISGRVLETCFDCEQPSDKQRSATPVTLSECSVKRVSHLKEQDSKWATWVKAPVATPKRRIGQKTSMFHAIIKTKWGMMMFVKVELSALVMDLIRLRRRKRRTIQTRGIKTNRKHYIPIRSPMSEKAARKSHETSSLNSAHLLHLKCNNSDCIFFRCKMEVGPAQRNWTHT